MLFVLFQLCAAGFREELYFLGPQHNAVMFKSTHHVCYASMEGTWVFNKQKLSLCDANVDCIGPFSSSKKYIPLPKLALIQQSIYHNDEILAKKFDGKIVLTQDYKFNSLGHTNEPIEASKHYFAKTTQDLYLRIKNEVAFFSKDGKCTCQIDKEFIRIDTLEGVFLVSANSWDLLMYCVFNGSIYVNQISLNSIQTNIYGVSVMNMQKQFSKYLPVELGIITLKLKNIEYQVDLKTCNVESIKNSNYEELIPGIKVFFINKFYFFSCHENYGGLVNYDYTFESKDKLSIVVEHNYYLIINKKV